MKKRGLLLGFLLRLLAATNKDFWFDEAFTFALAKQNLNHLFTANMADNNPPFYYLFLHFWMKLGQSELFLRFPSIIFGVISIYLIYLVGKTLFNERVAVFSSLLFALSPLQIYFSAETRMYSLWTFLVLTGFYFFLKILKNQQKSDYLLFAVCCLLSLYTHYFTIFFLLSIDFFLILKREKYKKQLINLLLAQVVLGLLFVPLVFFFLTNPHSKPWSFSPLIGIPATFISWVIGGLGQVTQKVYLLIPKTPLTIKFLFVLTTAFLSLIFLKGLTVRSKSENKLLLLITLFFPIALISFIHPFYPLYSPRAFVAFSFPFYLFLALGAESFSKKLVLELKIVTLAFLFFIIIVQNFSPLFKPTSIRQMANLLKEDAQKEDLIVHTSLFSFHSFLYYLPQLENQFLVFPSGLPKQTTDIIGGTPKSLVEIKKETRRIWLVVDARGTSREDMALIQKELSDYALPSTSKIGDLSTFLYSPNPNPNRVL